MSLRDKWETIGERFDVERPAPAAWWAPRPESPVSQIERGLDRPLTFGHPRVLLRGTPGTGKTTELLRVAGDRATRGDELVIYIDLWTHFNDVLADPQALQSLQAWEVCFLLGVALVRTTDTWLARRFYDQGTLEDLQAAWSALARETETELSGPQLDIGELARTMILLVSGVAAGAGGIVIAKGLAGLGGLASAVKWTLGRSRKKLSDQHSAMQRLADTVNRMVGQARTALGKRVLFIVDGLDRIVDRDRAVELFVESDMIGRTDTPMVVSAPFGLRHHIAVKSVARFTTHAALVNAPVLSEEDPSQPGPGVEFLREVYLRRVADIGGEALIPDDLLRRLAYYSGGVVRDFVRMVREVAAEAWTDDAWVVSGAMVDEVLKQWRHVYESGLFKEQIAILNEVAKNPKDDPGDNDRVRELVRYGRLLPYPNDSEWFYPHPLLTLSKVKTARRPP